MFLIALANCPDPESLALIYVGPDSHNGHQGGCDAVVQLPKLEDLYLRSRGPPRVRCILSRIEYLGPTYLQVDVDISYGSDLAETMTQIFYITHFRPFGALAT